MAGRKKNEMNVQLESVLDNGKFAHFVRWYCEGANKDTYVEEVSKKMGDDNKISYEYAIKHWLDREDIQNGISFYIRQKKNLNLMKK